MIPVLAVASGGAIGAVMRYFMASGIQRLTGAGFPWGTLAVNMIGALLMGLIMEAAARFWTMSSDLRLFLTTGILGGFTTFSAFSLETALMIEKGDFGPAALYITASVVLTVLFLFCGLWLVRSFAG
ncbi:Putative fluoride ion transporter CrcB [Alphaproteobacteria bacterium SO-S41]|nr:Putative fluoride ion transporter CrcB [Alphaproteobacteria bacterium SO-S41]